MSRRFDVSVVIPTYQGARYLRECLASVAAQDLDGVEVVLVDDASTDDTVAIAHSFAAQIADLRIEVNPKRLGAAGNVSRCMELARGRWIKPVFQDDMIDPGCLSAMRSARRRRVPLVVVARRYRYEGAVPEWQRAACEHLLDQSLTSRFGSGVLPGARVAEVAVETVANRVPQLNFVGEPVAMMFDRQAVVRAGGYDTSYVQLWDYELPIRLALRHGVVLIDEPLATFRVHGDSETARNLSGSAFGINVLDRLRLHVAYATGAAYGPVRVAATRHDPPHDLTASAVGVAAAARRVVEELPDGEREAASSAVATLAEPLPVAPLDEMRPNSPSTWETRNAEIAFLMEHSSRPLPHHLTALSQPDPVPAEGPEPPVEPTGPVEPTAPPALVNDEPEPSGSKPALSRVLNALRTNQWWGHMLGPLMAFACLQLGWRQVAPGDGIIRVLALIACAIALAAYGYVVNDTADVVPDRIAGKPNAMARFPVPARVAIIVFFGIAGAVPWFFLPFEWPAHIPFFGCYVVPLVYSMPPLRLKERHVLGPIADATNAFLFPALFAIALFAPFGETTGPHPLMLIGAVTWAMGFGLRAILKHQVDDAAEDRASGTRTLVTHLGERSVRHAIRRFIFPVEVAGSLLLAATVLTWSWGIVAVAVGYSLIFHGLRLSGTIDRGYATTTLENGYWMYWYQFWPAFVVSLGLAVWDPWYLLTTGFVLLLFWPRARSSFTIFGRCSRHELRRLRANRRARAAS